MKTILLTIVIIGSGTILPLALLLLAIRKFFQRSRSRLTFCIAATYALLAIASLLLSPFTNVALTIGCDRLQVNRLMRKYGDKPESTFIQRYGQPDLLIPGSDSTSHHMLYNETSPWFSQWKYDTVVTVSNGLITAIKKLHYS